MSWKAVANGRTAAAAATAERPAGIETSRSAATVTSSALPPEITSAATRSPTVKSEPPGPIASTVPTTSKPGVKGRGGGELAPWRARISPVATLAASIRIRTSPGPGSGTVSSTTCSTSAEPKSEMTTRRPVDDIALLNLGTPTSWVMGSVGATDADAELTSGALLAEHPGRETTIKHFVSQIEYGLVAASSQLVDET